MTERKDQPRLAKWLEQLDKSDDTTFQTYVQRLLAMVQGEDRAAAVTAVSRLDGLSESVRWATSWLSNPWAFGSSALWDLLLDPLCPPRVIEVIATSSDWQLRLNAAGHPNAALTMVRDMLTDDRDQVRAAAASNPVLPLEDIVRLIQGSDQYTRAGAAENPNCPPPLKAVVL